MGASSRRNVGSYPVLTASQDAAIAIQSIWSLPCTKERPLPGAPGHFRQGKISHDSTVSVLWSQNTWAKHTRSDRYLRSLTTWPRSTIVRGLAPVLSFLGVWTYCVWKLRLTFTTGALGYLSSPLALLLAFRVNSVVARFHEARKLWGQAIFKARNLASLLAASPEIDAPTRALCCRLLIAYGWTAKAATRYETDVERVLKALLPLDMAHEVANSRKPTLAIVSQLRKTTQTLDLASHVSRAVVSSISDLNGIFGGMERLVSTPLSPTYSRHTQRGLLLWLMMLPCSLRSAGCTTALKLVLVVTATSYIILGIDEIGIQVEQPFDALPLHGLATVMTRDVADEMLGPDWETAGGQ